VTANLNPTYEDPHETNQVTLETLRQIAIPAQNGSVLLGSITTNTLSEGRPSISHENRERIVTVSSELAEGGNTVAITNAFLKEMGTTELPQGVSLVIGGENEDAEQAFQDMFVALILGIILMLAVLVLQFNSYRYALYVLSIVPFSLIGIFIGLLVTGNALSFPSMMGFIALMGIVVNNSIILIDVINRVRQDNPTQDIHEVVLEASSSRLRPILLTTVTTVIGLIPLTFASELWSPIAIAIMSGLVFAVLITLVLVPVIYSRWPGKLPR
jgi:HAE1 family hydrophobic/amphiphilic exporter-1